MTPTGRDRALVVGASSAIGRAIAERLADDGFRLHLWGRDTRRLAECARACGRTGTPPPEVDAVDVTASGDLARAARTATGAGDLRVAVCARRSSGSSPTSRPEAHQPAEPGAPLNGPTTRAVRHPP